MVGRIVTKKAKRYTILTIFWTVIIFAFSLQPGDASSQISSGFGKWLIEVFFSGFIGEVEMLSTKQLEQLHFLLRKCAHFTEYFILGVWVSVALKWLPIYRKILLGLLYCILVASTDETIQLFVSGRSGRFSDVVLDSVGALCGIGFLLLIGKMFRGMRRLRAESCM